MDAGDQFLAVEGLRHIVIGAEAEAAHLGVHFRIARQDQHRGEDLRDAQFLEYIVAVHVGQVQVEQDDVVIIQLAQIEAFLAQVRRVHVEPFGREHKLDRPGHRRLVLDQQHSHRHRPFGQD